VLMYDDGDDGGNIDDDDDDDDNSDDDRFWLMMIMMITSLDDRPLTGFDDLIVDTLLSEMKKSGNKNIIIFIVR
jgi:hypothetical protein